jgi:sugar lactone lactonase YvrE
MKRVAKGFGLLEGARWYPEWGLVFSDMTRGGVFQLRSPRDAPTPVIPHRKGIGGLVAHEHGGFVVAGHNVAHKAADGTTTVLLQARDDEQFFNDLTADGRGRVYVGSVAINPLAGPSDGGAVAAGRLYRINLDGSVTVLAEDVLTSNGLAADPSDSLLYHVDTGRRLVWRLRINGTEDGGGRDQFVDTCEYEGEPDGLAVAADGSVWVAMAGGGVIVAWDAGGRRIAETHIPQPLATAVCLGGDDGTTMDVLTGVTDAYPDPDGGGIYVAAGSVRGLPGAVARVRTSV